MSTLRPVKLFKSGRKRAAPARPLLALLAELSPIDETFPEIEDRAPTDLIEFALANLALEDKFAETFKASRGAVDPDLKLGF